MKTAEETLLDYGYEDVIVFSGMSYDSALIGVTHDNRAVYDFQLMVEWLIINEGFSEEEALEWIDYNTLRGLDYFNESGKPIVMYTLDR